MAKPITLVVFDTEEDDVDSIWFGYDLSEVEDAIISNTIETYRISRKEAKGYIKNRYKIYGVDKEKITGLGYM